MRKPILSAEAVKLRIIVFANKTVHECSMEKDSLVMQLTEFLTSDSACTQTIGCLTDKAEIGISIADSVHLCVQHKNDAITVEERKPHTADFIFSATPSAIEVLISEKDLSPAQLGMKLMKQMMNQDISLAMPGNIFQISQKGYLKILKVGGAEFLGELKKHNLASVPKIMSALRKLKKS